MRTSFPLCLHGGLASFVKVNAHIYGGRKDVWKTIKNKQYLKRKILFTVFSFFSQAQQWKSLKLISAVYHHNSWIVNSAGECLFNNAIVRQVRRKFVKKFYWFWGTNLSTLFYCTVQESKLEIWRACSSDAFCLALALSNIHSIATIAPPLALLLLSKSLGNLCLE